MQLTQEELNNLPKEKLELMKKIAKRHQQLEEKSDLVWALISLGELLTINIKQGCVEKPSEQIDFLMEVLMSLEFKDLIKIK